MANVRNKYTKMNSPNWFGLSFVSNFSCTRQLCVCVFVCMRSLIPEMPFYNLAPHTHAHTRKKCFLLLLVTGYLHAFSLLCVVSFHPAGTSEILASAAAARPHIARSNTVLRSHILHTQRFKSTFFRNTNSFVRSFDFISHLCGV